MLEVAELKGGRLHAIAAGAGYTLCGRARGAWLTIREGYALDTVTCRQCRARQVFQAACGPTVACVCVVAGRADPECPYCDGITGI